jgi:protein TonB
MLFINPAPPPPPPLKSGDPMVLERESDAVPRPQPDRAEEGDEPEDTSRIMDRMVLPRQIPEDILKPDVDIAYGAEEGFDFGNPLGMEGGIPGGVVGGVPGGVLGGIIGGTGTQGVAQAPDVGPRPIRMPRPSYTVEAIRKKISGEVVLQAVIDVRGRVKVLKILRSIPELDAEAVRVVEEEWLFRPATTSGRPVPSLAELVVTFNLY